MSAEVGHRAPAYDVFLSYNRRDEETVRHVRELLETRGIQTFFDCQSLAAGLPWPQAIEQALLSARSAAVFIGPQGFGSWQRREMYFSLDRQATEEKNGRQFPVVPVLLNGADIQPCFLFLNTWIDLRSDPPSEDMLERLVRSVTAATVEQALVPAQRVRVCPYVGLRAFREEDAALYFGREAFTERLRRKVLEERQRVIGVVGPSGSGKSSVVMAGLIPELRKQRPPHPTWDALVFTPGRYPWRSLADALVRIREPDLPSEDQSARAAKLVESLRSGNGAVDSEFRRTLEDSKGTDRLLVVIDQFEELMILVQEEERKTFLSTLLELAELRPVTIVFTVRADYYGHALALHRELSDALERGQVNLGPMTEIEVRRVIEGPAWRVGLGLEPGLVDRILRDVSQQSGSLPLLEYALTSMWSQAADTLTAADYEKAGGVANSIGESAESIYRAFRSEEGRRACRQLATRLVHVTAAEEEGGDTRQSIRRSELTALEWAIAEQFAAPDKRLLVISADAASREETVEVAHEQLIRSWSSLREWLKEDRDFLIWRQYLGGFVNTWRKLGKGSNGLLQGRELQNAQVWLRKKRRDLNLEERRFISRSANRAIRRYAALAVLIVAGLVWVLWFGYQRTDRGQIASITSDIPRIAAQIPDTNIRSSELSSLTESLAKAERFGDAERTAAQIPDAKVRSRALSMLAVESLAKAERFGDAERAAAQISDTAGRSRALSMLGESLAKVGKAEASGKLFEDAEHAAAQIPEAFFRSSALTSLAESSAKAGQAEASGRLFEDAERAAAQISDTAGRSRALSMLGESLAKVGKAEASGKFFEDAERAAAQIPEAFGRSSALSSLAESMAKAGQAEASGRLFEDAERAAAQIPDADVDFQASALVILGESLAKAGKASGKLFEGVERAAAQIPNAFQRPSVLSSLAESLAKAGQAEASGKLFEDAEHAAAQLRNVQDRSRVLSILAESLARAGRRRDAERVIAQIEGVSERSNALSTLARSLAKAGNFRDARETARGCAPADALEAYATILDEYWKKRNMKTSK